MSTGESGNNSSENFDIELDPVLQGADQVKKTERPQVTMGEESDENTQDTQTRSNIHMGSDQSEGSAFPDGQYDGSEPLTGTEQGTISGGTATTDAEQNSFQTTTSSDLTAENLGDEGGRQEPVFSSGSSFSALDLDQAETGQEGDASLGTQGSSGENAQVSSAVQEESTTINGAPVAADDSFDTGEDSTYSIDVLANDLDPDADPLFITGVELQDGAGAVTHDGQQIIFNPGSAFDHLAEGDSETVTISYTVADPSGATDTAYVTLTVNGQNDAPVDISIAGNSLTENDEGAVIGTLSTTDVDSNDVHSYSVSDDRFEVVDGVLKLKEGVSLDHEMEPTVSVTVTAIDQSGAEVSKSFDFNVADINEVSENTGEIGGSEIDDNSDIVVDVEDPDNSGPVVEAVDLGDIDEDSSITFSAEDLLANAYDIDGDVLAVTEVMVDEAYGTIVDNGDGTWTFTPVENFNGTDVPLTFEATDGIETVSSTASLDVISVNDDPVVEAVNLGPIDEDSSITFSAEDLLANASDIDGDVLAVTEVTVDETYGAVVDNGDGTWTFSPAENFNGTDVPLTFEVTDGIETVSSTASLDVIAVNDGPVVDAGASPALSTAEDTAIVIQPSDLLGNASDIDGDALSVANLRIGNEVSEIPVTLKISGDHYDPNNVQDVGVGSPDFEVYVNGEKIEVNGETRFEVSAERGDWEYFSFDLPAGTEIDSIDVRFVNDAWEGTGDRDGDGVAGEDRNLIVDKINVGGSQDGSGDFIGGVTIEAEDASYARSSDVIDGRETMAWSGSLQFDLSNVPAADYNALVANEDGSWTFQPGADFNGDLTLTYDVVDGNGGVTEATATLTVTPENDAPVITTSLDGNAPVSFDTNNVVLSGDGTSGQLGDNVTIEGFATDGSAAVLQTSGDGVGIQGERIDTQIDYDPATGTSEQLVLTFDNPVTEVGLVTDRQIENEFPGGEQGKWTAYDANGNEIATGSLTPDTGTRLSGSSFSYNLETGDVPVAKIVIEATDATGQSSGDNSEFTVKSVSYTEVPEMLSDGVQLSTSVAEGAVNGTEAATISATDIDGDALSYAITSGNDDGAFVIDPQSGEVTVADGSLLDHETAASRTLTVEVADGNGGTDSVELVVNIDDVNEGPVAVADSFSGTEDQAVSGNVLTNDTDVDGDSLSVVADTIVTANGGTVELAADGSFTYTPVENFHGEDSFSYTMSDGSLTDSASVTLTVAPDNDGPVVGSVDLGATAEDNSITFSAEDLLANASDVDGDLLSVSSVDVDPAFGSVTDNGDGTWTFSPTENFSGDDVPVSFDVTDGTETVSSTASLDVTAVADAPEMHLSGSLTLDPAHGNYDLPADGILTIDVSYLSVNAGYNNSHGYYIADADGNPLGGAVIQDNVKDGDAKTITLDTSDYEGGVSLGFFIIPNGDNKNAGLEDGTEVTFENIDGVWTPMAGDQPLSGQGSPAYFSNQALNPDGYDHFSDSASEGNQNWEDLWGGGDGDYTDVNTQVEVALAPHEQQAVIAEVNTAADLPQIKTVIGDQDGSESLSVSISAIPEGAILSDGINSFEATAGNTSIDVSNWNLDGLTITATDGSDDFMLEVTTTSTESSNGDTASATQSINVEIADQVIEGTAGAQDLQGAGGDDTLVYNADSTWSGYAAHNVETGENVSLSGYNRSTDVFDGGSGHDVLQATSGDDALFLDDGISSFESGSQARIQNVEEINMGSGDDILDMTSSKYTYDQGVTVDGGDGNDVLWTSTGDDQITGGAGNDAMFGGDGNDMFIFGSNDGADSVSGGAGWTDAIELNGFTGSASEQGWTLTLESGDSIQSIDDASGEMLLSDDAAGTIIFDDGGQITFDGIEKIVW